MIPTEDQAKALWDTYELPEKKRIHVALVAKVARAMAKLLLDNNTCDAATNLPIVINVKLLVAGALLHDIDKNIPKQAGERHPDPAVRVLKEEGMEEVASVVAAHSLSAILDPKIAPKTWEEKLVYLADKMVKYEIITVDERFNLWRRESLPKEAMHELDQAYPFVKKLEQEIFTLLAVSPAELARLASK